MGVDLTGAVVQCSRDVLGGFVRGVHQNMRTFSSRERREHTAVAKDTGLVHVDGPI
jgi:hypothetical protein